MSDFNKDLQLLSMNVYYHQLELGSSYDEAFIHSHLTIFQFLYILNKSIDFLRIILEVKK